MQLIIAEKPSLGRNIVAAIQSDGKQKLSRHNGYYAGEKYLVTWAFGHLFSLCDIEAYNPNPRKDGRWCMDNLPCFPNQFRFELRHAPQSTKADPGVQKQFGYHSNTLSPYGCGYHHQRRRMQTVRAKLLCGSVSHTR